MALVVTLNIYSGSENPTWVLSDERSRQFIATLASINQQTEFKARTRPDPHGYRGFYVTSTPGLALSDGNLLINEGIADPGKSAPSLLDEDRSLEQLLFEAMPEGDVNYSFRAHMLAALSSPENKASSLLSFRGLSYDKVLLFHGEVEPRAPAFDAPPYEPGIWKPPCIVAHNNCYNYANDKMTHSWAQPGKFGGLGLKKTFSRGDLIGAAEKDLLVAKDNLDVDLGPGQGWYVAAAISEDGQDHHWYRQDANGFWSHKEGSEEPTTRDAAGQPILDPRNCSRGHYTNFCSYFITNKGIQIF